jgi:hypothetical protein
MAALAALAEQRAAVGQGRGGGRRTFDEHGKGKKGRGSESEIQFHVQLGSYGEADAPPMIWTVS